MQMAPGNSITTINNLIIFMATQPAGEGVDHPAVPEFILKDQRPPENARRPSTGLSFWLQRRMQGRGGGAERVISSTDSVSRLISFSSAPDRQYAPLALTSGHTGQLPQPRTFSSPSRSPVPENSPAISLDTRRDQKGVL